jgi:hypothetical protein
MSSLSQEIASRPFKRGHILKGYRLIVLIVFYPLASMACLDARQGRVLARNPSHELNLNGSCGISMMTFFLGTSVTHRKVVKQTGGKVKKRSFQVSIM